jgi:large subunit ribosomal protein L20
MTRVKKGISKIQKHKKILQAAKGFRGARSKLVRTAKEAVMHAGSYAYSGRKQRKTQARQLWVTKINAALGEKVSYKELIANSKKKNIQLDRKILADIAESDPETFQKIISK